MTDDGFPKGVRAALLFFGLLTLLAILSITQAIVPPSIGHEQDSTDGEPPIRSIELSTENGIQCGVMIRETDIPDDSTVKVTVNDGQPVYFLNATPDRNPASVIPVQSGDTVTIAAGPASEELVAISFPVKEDCSLEGLDKALS